MMPHDRRITSKAPKARRGDVLVISSSRLASLVQDTDTLLTEQQVRLSATAHLLLHSPARHRNKHGSSSKRCTRSSSKLLLLLTRSGCGWCALLCFWRAPVTSTSSSTPPAQAVQDTDNSTAHHAAEAREKVVRMCVWHCAFDEKAMVL